MKKASSGVRGKNYSQAAVRSLLDIVDERLPVGGDEWAQIAEIYNARTNETREGEDLRNKFKALRSVKKPTDSFQFDS